MVEKTNKATTFFVDIIIVMISRHYAVMFYLCVHIRYTVRHWLNEAFMGQAKDDCIPLQKKNHKNKKHQHNNMLGNHNITNYEESMEPIKSSPLILSSGAAIFFIIIIVHIEIPHR